MYLFSKYFNPRNFIFAEGGWSESLTVGGEKYAFEAVGSEDDVYHIRILNPSKWPRDHSRAGLSPLRNPDTSLKGRHSRLDVGSDGGFALKAGFGSALGGHLGRTFLQTLHGAAFGTCGKAWLFQFRQRPDMQFYGMGEKNTPFERSDRSFRFWNSDVWADHGTSKAKSAAYDPDYMSIPYMIVKRGNTYAGILLDNPHASVISISPRLNVANQMMAAEHPEPLIYLGAEDGIPSLYILFGPSLAELTAKFQRLVGMMPVPPLWSLGHHQCRWGYESAEDLRGLADNFDRIEFPNDGLWLDIDYMRGYRVFTFDKAHFPDVKTDLAAIHARGYKVVPILDPGVKKEPGFEVYDSGRKADVFCRNAAGTEFAGLVWPGYTVFPDFTLERTQAWWAGHVAEFAALGVDGAWLDMNDPSTGQVDPHGMLFDEGRVDHGAYHNQYASLMAQASYRGFLAARPDRRPFLLSRSGYTGDQKHTAHWTGDNWSNYHHLHMSIGKCLNLALSGMSFVGPDVPGFGGNAKENLFVDWYKAGFLFPFLRNHAMRGTRNQEPWTFSPEAMAIARRYVRLRYKLLPYLYNLFLRHSETGEPVMRPLFHDFQDTKRLPLAHVNDQFLVGPHIMQAPFTVEGQDEREIAIPDARWWRADVPGWVEGPGKIKTKKRIANTPLFLREGALLPMQRGIPKDHRKDLLDIELLVVLPAGGKASATERYACDDGETFAYRTGMVS
ncbi:MAG TPA: glycoside hydrolase family 31 protein, partial [Fibrobacteria bacterium]|nr:glycoside hydrolase family 31 protein [Fibrobacteria bacterium]